MALIPYSVTLVLLSIFVGNILNLETTGDICSFKRCIKKCCPKDHHVASRRRKCDPDGDSNFNITLNVYDAVLRDTGKSFVDLFHLDTNPPAFKVREFRKSAFESINFGFNVYLTEDGKLYLERPNAFIRWIPREINQYCVDYHEIKKDNSSYPAVGVWALFESDDQMPEATRFHTIGMCISCVFLVLVLVVYSLLPELRNIGGRVMMAYTASLLFAFIFLMVVQAGGLSSLGCVSITMSVYFFFLSSFCWMNIMSYDIWWTFRGYAKARPIHRRGEVFKFLMYCVYAWGVPLLMTVMLAVLNYADMSHLPWLITPKIPDKGCFLEGGEKLVYLYAPMLIMIVLNWLFFLMTAFNIWRLSRGTSVLDSAAAGNPASHRKQRHRLLVYLKLSVLMGLNWILEVVSSFKPDLRIWYISDGYNLLMGFFIFVIFVCKKNILKKLDKRLFPVKSISRYPSSKSSRSRSNSITETSNISQEFPDIIMNPNAKGAKFV